MTSLSPEARKMKRGILKKYSFPDHDILGKATLELAMRSWDMVQQATKQIAEEGLTVAGQRGCERAHPLFQVIRAQKSQFLACIKALDLAPDAVPPAPQIDTGWYEKQMKERAERKRKEAANGKK